MTSMLDFDNIISGLNEMHISAVVHAAEISPMVMERTIGPDKLSWVDEDAEDAPIKHNQNAEKTLPQKAATKPKIDNGAQTVSATTKASICVEAMNDTISLRMAEEELKSAMRVKVENFQKMLSAKCRETIACNYDISERKTWLEQRDKETQQMIQEAEQASAKEMAARRAAFDLERQNIEKKMQAKAVRCMAESQQRFRREHEAIVKLLLSNQQKLKNPDEYNAKLRNLIQMFDQLIAQLKQGKCGLNELRIADKYTTTLISIKQDIKAELLEVEKQLKQQQLEEQRQQLELKKQQLEQQKLKLAQQQQQQAELKQKEQELQQQQLQQQQQQQQAQNAAIASLPAATTVTAAAPLPAAPPGVRQVNLQFQLISEERRQFYNYIMAIYQEKVERVKPLQADDSWKKWRTTCLRIINTPINAIAAGSAQNLQDKFDKLYSIFAGQQQRTSDNQMISMQDHPLGRDYCLLLMAKKFVSQGDTEISSNPKAAHPIATIVVALWKAIPEFGQLFLAYTYKESPFLLPQLVKQEPGMSTDDYYKSLGYRINNGELEPQASYLKRQSGIARLYAAVMITPGRRADAHLPHPFYVNQCWIWFSNFVRLPPLPDISATLIVEILQIVVSEMWRYYGRQFVKILAYIQFLYLRVMPEAEVKGPKERLEQLLARILQEGLIPPAQGALPPNFW